MTFFTVISLLIALFGASHAIMAAIRSHSEAVLKKTVEDTIARCDKLLGDAINPAAQWKSDVQEHRASAENALKAWRTALMTPTFCFSFAITVVLIWVELTPWTDSGGRVLEFPVSSVIWVKIVLGVYFIILAWAIARLKKQTRNAKTAYKSAVTIETTANTFKNQAAIEPQAGQV